MNAATFFLGISVGVTMTTDAFLELDDYRYRDWRFLAFCTFNLRWYFLSWKIFNLFTKKKINPLIGATGLSAVPMASRSQ